MKKHTVLATFLMISAVISAQPMRHAAFASRDQLGLPIQGDYAKAELSAIEGEFGTTTLGEIRVNQLVSLSARMERAIAKDVYLRSTAAMSLMMPGAGQFRNGEAPAGTGFLALHLGTVAGGLAAFYFLMPADLRFDQLDYVSSPHGDIRDAWKAHSISDYAAAIAPRAAAALLDTGVRYWSATAAYASAKTAIDQGRAKLVPVVGPGFLGACLRF
jgi:hypothetical protein